VTIDRRTADDAFEVLSALALELDATARELVAEFTFEQCADALLYIAHGYVGMLQGLAQASGQTTEDVLRRLALIRQQGR
jgi:hypothetical protein